MPCQPPTYFVVSLSCWSTTLKASPRLSTAGFAYCSRLIARDTSFRFIPMFCFVRLGVTRFDSLTVVWFDGDCSGRDAPTARPLGGRGWWGWHTQRTARGAVLTGCAAAPRRGAGRVTNGRAGLCAGRRVIRCSTAAERFSRIPVIPRRGSAGRSSAPGGPSRRSSSPSRASAGACRSSCRSRRCRSTCRGSPGRAACRSARR